MSRQHDLLLKRLCHDKETLEKARSILHTASIKTVPGSGYNLGQGASGLPAICAYLAAEELGDSDITEQLAQQSSCLKPKLFQTTLNTVRSALDAAKAATSPRKTTRKVTYGTLLETHKFGRKGTVASWMQSAEQALMSNREMKRRFGSSYDTITVAVFCWTCLHMTGKTRKVNADALRNEYNIQRDQFEEITDALHELCEDVAKKIKDDIASLRAQPVPTKPARGEDPIPAKEHSYPPLTPTTARSLTKSPSKSAMRAPSADLSPTKTPSHKRKVAFDGPIAEEDEEEFDALATPSKKQKFSSPLKAIPSTPTTPRVSSRLAAVAAERATRAADEDDQRPVAGPSTPRRPRTTPSRASSTHSNRSARLDSAPSTPRRKPMLPTVHEEQETRRRRYRPAFADQKQWLKGDSRLERELKPWTERWRELVKKADGNVWKAAEMAGEVRVAS